MTGDGGLSQQLAVQVIYLGRGLISAQPNTNGRELDEGKIVGCESVVAGGDTTTLLYFIEKSLNQVSRTVEVWAEADCLLAISFRRDGLTNALIQSAS